MSVELTKASAVGSAAVAISALGCVAAGSLYGWSALAPVLMARFGVAHAETGQTFSLAIVAFTAGTLLAPRLGPRGLGTLGAALAAGALFVLAASRAPAFDAFLALYSLGFGIASGAAYITAVEIASRGPRPGWGVPLVVAAFGLGGALFGGLLGRRVAEGAGLGALDWVATALAASATLALLAAGRASVAPAAPASAPDQPPSVRTLLRLWVVFATGSLGGLVALGLAHPIAADRGAGAWLSAAVVVAVALGNVAGRLGAGLLAWHLAPATVLATAQVLGGLAMALLLLPTGPGAAALLMATVAVGYGLTAAGVPLLARAVVGPAAFARTYGVIFTGWGTAGLVGPWLAGSLRDRTGSWEAGLALAAGGSLVALVALVTERWTRA